MLRVTLHVNAEQIGDYEVRNVTSPEVYTPTGPCTYEVRQIDADWLVDSTPLFRIMHKRSEGAEKLASKVLAQVARERVR